MQGTVKKVIIKTYPSTVVQAGAAMKAPII